MSSLLNSLVRIGEFVTNDDLVLDPKVPKDTVAPPPPATVPNGSKVTVRKSVRHSKSSASLEPVPEQSSEDSLDSKTRTELLKSLSTVNCKSLVPDRPPIPDYTNGAKEWNGVGILKKRKGSLDRVFRDEDTASNGSKSNGSGILKKKDRKGSLDGVFRNTASNGSGILKKRKEVNDDSRIFEKNLKLKRSFSAKILMRIGSIGKPRVVEKAKSADGEKTKKRVGSIKRLRRAVSFHDEEHRTTTPESVTPKSADSESLSSVEAKKNKNGFRKLKRALSFKNGRAGGRVKERRGSLDAVHRDEDTESNGSGILKKGGGFRNKLRRAVSFHNQSTTRTISSDGAGLLEPISSQTKAFSCMSINSNGNTDESDGPLRMSMTGDEEVLARDPRTLSKHKYFSPPVDRNIISKYIAPTFHERSRSFRKLFNNLVPQDEKMLASYSCAYQREILVQGRIYISSRHFCFHANIFGWGTIFVIPIADVTEILKEKTMYMFPNSIQLNTVLRGRFFFASFTNRDKSLRAMHYAWNQIHSGGPALTPDQFYDLMNPAVSTEDNEKEEGKGEEERAEEKMKNKEKNRKEKAKEKPEKRSSKQRQKASLSVSSADDQPAMLKTASAPNLDPADQQHQRAAAGACALVDEADAAERSSSSSTTTADISMTECICDDHTGKKLMDQVFPKTQSELFDLIFTTSPWYVQLNQALKRTVYSKMPLKYTGYSASEWATNKEGVRQRTCTYTMALNHAMAPKSCIVTEKQVYKAFPGGFTIVKETVNSGVPYSDSFHVSCTYCVMGYGRGQARLTVHGGLVFSKSVWGMIRGYIERSTTQGLAEHYDALLSALSEECKRSAAGADDTLEEDQNRMDTSSEEGGEAETGAPGNMRGMAGSISGINFVQHAARMHEEPCFELPLVGRVRRIDFYGVAILALLSLMAFSLILLVLRLPSSTADSRLADAFHRYLTPGSAPPAEAARPDLDSLIVAIGRIGAQLQQVRDAAANNARVEL